MSNSVSLAVVERQSPTPHPICVDALESSLRSRQKLIAQRSKSNSAESEPTDRLRATAEPPSSGTTESPSPSSSASSASYKPGYSVIIKAVPSVAGFPEQPKVWKRLPPRLPIPKWDVDD